MNCVKELCEKSFQNKLCGIPHAWTEQLSLLNYKNSTNQTFNFISAKVTAM